MKVKLAAQTLSLSVANALEYMKTVDKRFENCDATIKFIKMFNGLFDLLNSKSRFGKNLKCPISPETKDTCFQYFSAADTYIAGLKNRYGVKVLESANRTGFFGFSIALQNFKKIYNKYCLNGPLDYILTYKFSQDHLETLFSVIRSRGGFNNNPTAIQFSSAFKQILIHNEIKSSAESNCLPLDKTSILHVSSSSRTIKILNSTSNLGDEFAFEQNEFDEIEDENEIPFHLISPVISEAVYYISGYVERKLRRKISCKECIKILNERPYFNKNNKRTLIDIKQYEDCHIGLVYPKKDIVK